MSSWKRQAELDGQKGKSKGKKPKPGAVGVVNTGPPNPTARSGEEWNTEERTCISEMIEFGVAIADIARFTQRTHIAICSRLVHMGMLASSTGKAYDPYAVVVYSRNGVPVYTHTPKGIPLNKGSTQ